MHAGSVHGTNFMNFDVYFEQTRWLAFEDKVSGRRDCFDHSFMFDYNSLTQIRHFNIGFVDATNASTSGRVRAGQD